MTLTASLFPAVLYYFSLLCSNFPLFLPIWETNLPFRHETHAQKNPKRDNDAKKAPILCFWKVLFKACQGLMTTSDDKFRWHSSEQQIPHLEEVHSDQELRYKWLKVKDYVGYVWEDGTWDLKDDGDWWERRMVLVQTCERSLPFQPITCD